jgi:hypothetical protein
VPYTGFEAGTVLTYAFYSAIALWGIAVAYALVMKKTAVAVVATSAGVAPMIAGVSGAIQHTTTDMAPFNLGVQESLVQDSETTDAPDALRALEMYAHEHNALISSEALRFIAGQEDAEATLGRVIALAKARYPKEGEWIVINKERVLAVLA